MRLAPFELPGNWKKAGAMLLAALALLNWDRARAAEAPTPPLAVNKPIGGMDPDSTFLVKVSAPFAAIPLVGADLGSTTTAQRTDAYGLANLALRPQAKASASGTLPGYAIHRIKHLNDGLLGNDHSWIANEPTGWAEIDLGDAFHICRVALGSDSSGAYKGSREPTAFTIQVALAPGEDSKWETAYA